jgi:hypothetical protein
MMRRGAPWRLHPFGRVVLPERILFFRGRGHARSGFARQRPGAATVPWLVSHHGIAAAHRRSNYRHGPLGTRSGAGAPSAVRPAPPHPTLTEVIAAMSDPDQTVPVRFHLLAEASPGLIPRLLQPLAKRDLVPDLLLARREGDAMRVEIALDAMPAGMVHLVAGNLAQVVGVMELRGGMEARRAA